MSTPPDLEEGPPLSRQRVSRACDLCRRKKVKCDGATPVCTNCKTVGLECTFKDMTKKRGPPKGYIEAIENRLYKLENFLAGLAKGGDVESKQLLLELNSPLETPSGERIRARPVRRAPRSERSKVFFWQQDKAGKRKRESLLHSDSNSNDQHHATMATEHEDDGNNHSGSDSNDDSTHEDHRNQSREQSTDEGVGQLAMDENGQVRYLGKSSGYYLLQNSRTYQNGAFHFANYGNRPKRQQHKIGTRSNVDPLELPPKDLSEHLIVLYFQQFYPFLPLFFKRQLFSGAASNNPAIEPVAPLLLNAIYAVASRISPDIRVRSDPSFPDTAGDIFFERAEKLLDESYDTPSISTVQALVLLASHQHGAMKSARAWMYSGMAFRMAQDLGLHRNCDHWNIPPDECERRKRVFWCCYVVDRLSSAMYGRASTFEEKDCDVPFPSVDDDNPLRDTDPPVRMLDLFTNLIKISDILGHVLRNIYYVRSLQNTAVRQVDSVVTTWNRKLHQWFDHLPESLQIKKDGSNNIILPPTAVCQLHMIYHTTMILLHRPFIPGPDQSLIPSLLPCASICSSAADSVLSITNALLAENKLRYTMNYAVYYIFTSGILFIKSASAISKTPADNTKAIQAKVKVNKCMQALDDLEATWTTASKSCQILAELSGIRDVSLDKDRQYSPQSYSISTDSWQPTLPQLPQLPHPQDNGYYSQQQQPSLGYTNSQNYLQPHSPQSTSTASPQLQPEPEHHRLNSSNLRFPITRLGLKPDQVERDEREIYSTSQMDFSTPNYLQVQNNTPVNNATAMDPFAAPGTIPVSTSRQYDPLGGTFWGVPSSLDVNEWNSFMSSDMNNQHTAPYSNTSVTCLQDRQFYEQQNGANGRSSSSSNPAAAAADYSQLQRPQAKQHHLVHNTDVAMDQRAVAAVTGSGSPNMTRVLAAPTATHSPLLGYLPQQTDSNTRQSTPDNTSNRGTPNKKIIDGGPSNNNNPNRAAALKTDMSNAFYW